MMPVSLVARSSLIPMVAGVLTVEVHSVGRTSPRSIVLLHTLLVGSVRVSSTIYFIIPDVYVLS